MRQIYKLMAISNYSKNKGINQKSGRGELIIAMGAGTVSGDFVETLLELIEAKV